MHLEKRINTPPVLLPYQQAWIKDTSPVKVWLKSRRIGASWCEAGDDALYSASQAGDDTHYIGYNREMAREFIDELERWSADKPVTARSESLIERTSRLTRKYRAASIATLAAFALVSIVSTIALYSVNQARNDEIRHRDIAQQAENGPGIAIPSTRSGERARTARCAVTAESIPPDRPMTAPRGRPCLRK